MAAGRARANARREEIMVMSENDAVDETTPETDYDAQPYLKMIEQASSVFEQYQNICDSLAKDYANLGRLATARADREFQIFAANLEVVKPSIYSRPPQPVVVPRFKDRKPVPRHTSELLERALATSFDAEKLHETMKRVRDDLALFGRGVIWARYDISAGGDERIRYEWLNRKDFLHEPARIWSEVGWVARGTWVKRTAGETRFGERWTQIVYQNAEDSADKYNVEKKARVWELWHRGKNLVAWVHPNKLEALDIQTPPHLRLDGFFPCPRPAYGTLQDDTLIPVPDACFYKDQLEEINELTARISALSESLKLAVFYPAGAEEFGVAFEAAMMQLSQDNRRLFYPLAGLGQMAMTGARLGDALWELPVNTVSTTIQQLVMLRKQLIEDVYQISGVSDIMRGETSASETLGAQQLKSQYGSIRMKDRQSEMVRVCDQLLNIAGEIMSENFQPQTLLSMGQTELPTQADLIQQHQQEADQEIKAAVQQLQAAVQQGQPMPPMDEIQKARDAIIAKHEQAVAQVVTVEQVFALLRQQRIRPFILQIATDSTIQPDENAEKQRRAEFGTAFSNTLAAMTPLVQAAPAESADFVGEMLKFQLAPYRAGRSMEQSIDELVENLKQRAKAPPPPNPEAEASQMEIELKKADLEDRKLDRENRMKEREQASAQAERDSQREQQRAAMETADRDEARRVRLLEAQAEAEKAYWMAQDAGDRRTHEKWLREHEKAMADMKMRAAAVPQQTQQPMEYAES